MPLPQDTCRLFWVATTLRVKQALRNHAAANDVRRIGCTNLATLATPTSQREDAYCSFAYSAFA
jgi:hypothetical protein